MNNRTLTIKEYTEVDVSQMQDITVVYCRLSNDDGNAGDSNSIINQKKILGEVVIKEGLSNPIYFIDDGISGTTLKYRPAITKAIELVEMGKVANFLVKDLSRLARNYLDAGKLTEITFPAHDVRFIAVNDGIDSDHQTDNDANLLPLKSLFNDWYARDTSKKIRAVMKSRAEAGERMIVIPIYGYQRDPANAKNWLVDPIASEVVRRIFTEIKAGKGPTVIAKGLEKDKIETPSRRLKQLGEKPRELSYTHYNWSGAAVEDILSKMEYLGHTVNNKTYRKSHKDNRAYQNPRDQWLIFENTQEAIIDQDTFDIVQKMRQHKRIPSRNLRYEKGHENLFAGLVFCGTCGQKHYYCAFEKNGRNLDHYKCSRYAKTVDRCDNPHYIRKSELGEMVLADINQLLQTINFNEGKFLKQLERAFEIESSKQTNKQRQKLVNKERRYEEIEHIIPKLYEDNLSGKLSDERFMKMSQTYETEQVTLGESIKILKTELSEKDQQSKDITCFMHRIQKYTQIEELTVEIVNELIDRIIIYKPVGKTRGRIMNITIQYNFIGELTNISE